MYTSRLIVIPNYGNPRRSSSSSNSSYSFHHERFRSTLIVVPNTNCKRFIQGIDVRCGGGDSSNNNLDGQEPPVHRFKSISPIGTPSDVVSVDESICELYPIVEGPPKGESYFDVRHRLLARSNLFHYTIKDQSDGDESDCLRSSSRQQETYHKKQCYR